MLKCIRMLIVSNVLVFTNLSNVVTPQLRKRPLQLFVVPVSTGYKARTILTCCKDKNEPTPHTTLCFILVLSTYFTLSNASSVQLSCTALVCHEIHQNPN